MLETKILNILDQLQKPSREYVFIDLDLYCLYIFVITFEIINFTKREHAWNANLTNILLKRACRKFISKSNIFFYGFFLPQMHNKEVINFINNIWVFEK